MYKNASDDAQSKLNRSELTERKNVHGVDQSAFAKHAAADPKRDREKIIRDKTQVETQLAMLHAQLARAKTSFRSNHPNQTGYDTVAKWESQRSNLIGKLGRMNALLSNMNYEFRMKEAEQQDQVDDFPQLFMLMAKELLVEEIYNRVFVAAIHKQKERRRK